MLSQILWGGHEINDGNHTIPECYGASAPTAIFVPLAEMMKDEEKFKIATKEIFAPFYVVTEYKDEDLPRVLEVLGKSCRTSPLDQVLRVLA